MKKKLILLLVFCWHLFANAQQVTIELSYSTNLPGFNKEAFHFDLNKKLYALGTGKIPAYSLKNIKSLKTDSGYKTITSYAIQDTSLGIFGDLFGHEVILIPGDTMKVSVTKLEKPDKDILLPWYYGLTYSGPNKYIYTLFDSLGYLTCDVKSDMVNPKGKTLDEFIRITDARFQSRTDFLNGYCIRHTIPPNIKELVYHEIYAAYVRDLVFFQSGLKGDGIEPDIRALLNPKIDGNKLKTDVFSKGVIAPHVIYQYLLVMKLPFQSANFYNKERLTRVYDFIKNDYSGEMRDDLLFRHLKQFTTYGNPADIDKSVMALFRADCKNDEFVIYMDSLLLTKEEQTKLSFKDVMNTPITDTDGKPLLLKDKIAKKPVLIDCWASWCRPCIDEFPFSRNLEEIYRGQVDFIYLSFDKDVKAWKLKGKELNLPSSYHVTDSFEGDFAVYFRLHTIPRYILIDSAGNLVNADSPRPSDPKLKELFNSLLDKKEL